MPSRNRRSSALERGNPFKDDPELKKQLAQLGAVDNQSEFNGWRFSFLTKFDSFLDTDGTENAEEAYQDFKEAVARLVKIVSLLESLIETGGLTKNHAGVKAKKCMEEIKAECMYTSDDLAELLPGSTTQDDAVKRGYTK